MDSGGLLLKHVYGDPDMDQSDEIPDVKGDERKEKLKLWVMNLEIWGSFEPFSSQCFDIELTRAGAYAKICQLKKRLDFLAEFWHARELGADEYQLKDLANQTSIFASLVGKIEQHLARKVTR